MTAVSLKRCLIAVSDAKVAPIDGLYARDLVKMIGTCFDLKDSEIKPRHTKDRSAHSFVEAIYVMTFS
jgi:hypothetical protein